MSVISPHHDSSNSYGGSIMSRVPFALQLLIAAVLLLCEAAYGESKKNQVAFFSPAYFNLGTLQVRASSESTAAIMPISDPIEVQSVWMNADSAQFVLATEPSSSNAVKGPGVVKVRYTAKGAPMLHFGAVMAKTRISREHISQCYERARNRYEKECSLVDRVMRQAALEAKAATEQITDKIATLNDKLAIIYKEREVTVKEFRDGHYCSKCRRTASQIEKADGIAFLVHVRNVQGEVLRPTEEEILAKFHEFDAQILPVQREISLLDTSKLGVEEALKKRNRELFEVRDKAKRAYDAEQRKIDVLARKEETISLNFTAEAVAAPGRVQANEPPPVTDPPKKKLNQKIPYNYGYLSFQGTYLDGTTTRFFRATSQVLLFCSVHDTHESMIQMFNREMESGIQDALATDNYDITTREFFKYIKGKTASQTLSLARLSISGVKKISVWVSDSSYTYGCYDDGSGP